jgi:hypothetical protein
MSERVDRAWIEASSRAAPLARCGMLFTNVATHHTCRDSLDDFVADLSRSRHEVG